MIIQNNTVEIRHFHLFCGLGGGAKGFNQGRASLGPLQASFRCLGGVDNDPAAIRDFEQLAGAPGTVLDLFSREQYTAFHGHEPPTDWREATPADLRRAAGNERPHIVFTSSPCKGLSGLLSEEKSKTAKYRALNELTLRGVWLTLEAWADDPPEFILFENVPRIQTRGRPLLDQIIELLQHYGYATAETVHDCGELGGLAQSRRRFLLVARHQAKVPPFLYEPMKRPLRAVGHVLEQLPLPGDPAAGPMHRVPSLQWRTWVRLALVEAGSDWRSLERLRVENGALADYGIIPERLYAGGYGVCAWSEPAGVVAGESLPSNGKFAVADPRRPAGSAHYFQYGVLRWQEASGAISGQSAAGGGRYSVADPRMPPSADRHVNLYRVIRWDKSAFTVTGAGHTAGGAQSIADPRPGLDANRAHYQTAGHYGVVRWDAAAGAVVGKAKHDTGRWSVADPRAELGADCSADQALPAATDRGVFVIRAEDGTWHRPFTTLELAALQGLVDPGGLFTLDGRSDAAWRERIGNAVPAPTGAAIASVMGTTLLLAWTGETFVLSNQPIWVRPIAVALSVDSGRDAA